MGKSMAPASLVFAVMFSAFFSAAAMAEGPSPADNPTQEPPKAEAARPEASPLMKAVEYLKPNLSGYIEAWYRHDSSDLSNQTANAKKVDNEFRLRRARLTASGNATDALSYKLTANLDGPSPASGTASVKLWDAYMTYKFHQLAAVTLGQFKYDFSREGLETTPDRVPVLRAESINDIAGKLGTAGGSFRDIGLKVNGTAEKLLGLTYGLDLINGSGINTGDNNNHKDIVARATITPLKGLTLGASGYTGEGQIQTGAFNINEVAWDLEAEYIREGLKLRGEYIWAKWENWDAASSAASVGKSQKPNGWYLQASYRLPMNIEFMGRYEDYEKDANTPHSRLKTTTFGVGYYITGKTRVVANYLIRSADSSNIVTAQETDATGSRIKNMFILQALLAF